MSTLQTYENWSARAYLDQYYSGDSIPDDSEVLISFLQRNLGDRRFRTCLDFGCGPSLYAHFAIVDRYDEVTWADYAADNRAEIEKWLNSSEDAFDWSHYARHALELVGNEPTEAAIEALESKLRQKSADVIPADITSIAPLGERRTFDLVLSCFCLECVASSFDEWRTYVGRLWQLVSHGGRLLLVSLRGSTYYKVLDRQFPATPLTANLVENELAHYCDVEASQSLVIEDHSVDDWRAEGFSGIILAKLDKPARPATERDKVAST